MVHRVDSIVQMAPADVATGAARGRRVASEAAPQRSPGPVHGSHAGGGEPRRDRAPRPIPPLYRRVVVIPAPGGDGIALRDVVHLLAGPVAACRILHLCDGATDTGSAPVRAESFTCHRCVGPGSAACAGRPLPDDIFATLRRERADLIVSGMPEHPRVRRRYVRWLLRNAPCSVCLLPAGSPRPGGPVGVGVDGLGMSRPSVTSALRVAARRGENELLCLHVFSVPAGHLRSGKRFGESAEIMRAHAERRLYAAVRGIRTGGVRVRFVYELDDSPVRGIRRAMEREGVGMMVLGARGRSGALSALLMPSACERVLENARVCCLVIRGKDNGLTLWQAMLAL